MDADEDARQHSSLNSIVFLVGLWFAECLATIDEYDSTSSPAHDTGADTSATLEVQANG